VVDEFVIELSPPEAARACRAAIILFDWRIDSDLPNELVLATPPVRGGAGARITASFAASSDQRTRVTLEAPGSAEPRQLREQMSRLRSALELAAGRAPSEPVPAPGPVPERDLAPGLTPEDLLGPTRPSPTPQSFKWLGAVRGRGRGGRRRVRDRVDRDAQRDSEDRTAVSERVSAGPDGAPVGHDADRAVIRHLLAPVLPPAAHALLIPRTVARSAHGVALTFDDGPHPEGTPAVLATLASSGLTAMFFVIGEQVERRPELVREIVAHGHAVALHGYRHRLQLRLGAAEVQDDLRRGAAAIEDAAGLAPRYHRPPYGIYSPSGLAAARNAGLQPLLWSRWGKDWRKFTTPARIAARSTRGLSTGDVILLHDADFYSSRNSHRRTVAALALIATELQRRKIATVLPV
jgi:peptidoglycan/xylan/chitin deacetylase (PgdA/CDA1 family)